MKRVMIAAGGTGGHIFPALAVAEQLIAQGVVVHWVGSRRGLEERLVAPQFPITYLNVEALRGKRRWLQLKRLAGLCWATLKMVRVIRRERPDVVLTMGGFVSAPVGMAAWLCRRCLVVHEQNARPGMVNRYLSRLASVVLQGYSSAFSPTKKVMTVGNPVRPALLNAALPAARYGQRKGLFRVLVLGGSQGAHAINTAVLDWVDYYALADEVEVWHQTGRSDCARLTREYDRMDVTVRVDAFIEDMVSAYTWADLVICRAGAMTVTEVTAVGVAALFVPLPSAADNHQFHNAASLVDNDAGQIIEESALTAARLAAVLDTFASDRTQALRLAERSRELVKGQAVADIIKVMTELSRGRGIKEVADVN